MALAALCLVLASCAQTGPPLPPSLELPKPPTDLRASRKGDRVTLIWSEPTLTTDRQSVRYLGSTLICRSLQSEMASCGKPTATMPAPAPVPQKPVARRDGAQKSNAGASAQQSYTDTLPVNLQKEDPSAEATYAVEVLNRNARGAGLSNRVRVPAVITVPPPSDVRAELTGDGVVLTWTSVGKAQNTSTKPPANTPNQEIRYRIYRRNESSGKDAVAGELPLDGRGPLRFTDSGFEWEKTYLYRITAVTTIRHADSEVDVEGDDSASVRVIAHDVFPPAVPTGLQAAYSGEGQKPFIDLIWAPVTNADLAGYNVYRGEAGGSAVAKMVKLNSALVASPAYRDTAVTSGKTYRYSVSSVDVRGNESQRSEETSESVH